MIIGSEILCFESLPSTNSEASLLLKKGKTREGTVICCDFQTAGRGQPGNRWESEKGKNLLISIILYPERVIPEEQFILTMVISLALCELLKSHLIDSKIKWPNDVYFGNDKIAGILIENSIIGGKIESTVVGTGLNINQTYFSDFIPNPISMKKITGKSFDRDIIMKQFLEILDVRYKQLLYGDRKNLRNEYISCLYRFGEWHRFRSGHISFPGKIIDVSASGKIIIEEKNGSAREFAFKDVSFII